MSQQIIKEDYKDTVAAAIINSGSLVQSECQSGKHDLKGEFQIKSGQRELRVRRVGCLFAKSLYDNIKTISKREGVSVNDLIHQVMSDYVVKLKER
jgi:uncharacterized protein (DUF111 family)